MTFVNSEAVFQNPLARLPQEHTHTHTHCQRYSTRCCYSRALGSLFWIPMLWVLLFGSKGFCIFPCLWSFQWPLVRNIKFIALRLWVAEKNLWRQNSDNGNIVGSCMVLLATKIWLPIVWQDVRRMMKSWCVNRDLLFPGWEFHFQQLV